MSNYNIEKDDICNLTSLIKSDTNLRLLDAGCGDGIFTKELVSLGYNVVGLDNSKELLELFKKNNPNIPFIEANLLTFNTKQPFDIIFSNSCFHLIERKDQHMLAVRLNKALKQNGELVFEFEGYNSSSKVHKTLERIFNENGLLYKNDYYLPTIREHANVLEDHGFLITDAILYSKFMKIKKGLRYWIESNIKKAFDIVPIDLKEEIIEEALDRLKNELFIDNEWYIDTARIRMRAIKIK